ncbi:MAG: site-2 protease family protein [Oscillospiraceae bacterium]|nr:site-2 protease family protein [Oscillospiraceae bacterium]
MNKNNHPKFSISVGAAVFIVAFFAVGDARLLLLIFIAAGGHELGHYAALRFCGGRVSELRLGITGVSMRHQHSTAYADEILIASGGPMASAVLSSISAIAARLTQADITYQLAGMSLLLCLFNLLPVLPLDGGRILYAAISSRSANPTIADRVTCVTSCAVIFFALTAGAYVLVVTGTNFTLLITAGWMLIHYCKSGNNSIKYVGYDYRNNKRF